MPTCRGCLIEGHSSYSATEECCIICKECDFVFEADTSQMNQKQYEEAFNKAIKSWTAYKRKAELEKKKAGPKKKKLDHLIKENEHLNEKSSSKFQVPPAVYNCLTCQGTLLCPACHGSGWVDSGGSATNIVIVNSSGYGRSRLPCKACSGTGRCPNCCQDSICMERTYRIMHETNSRTGLPPI